MMNIGDRIAEVRKSNGLTQQMLADKIDGMTVQMISSYENNKQQPSLKNIIKIAEILDVSLDYLIIGEEKRHILTDCSQNGQLYDICKMIFKSIELGFASEMISGKSYMLFIMDKAINKFIGDYQKIKDARQAMGEELYKQSVEHLLESIKLTKIE